MSQAALDALEHYAFSGEEGAGGIDTPPEQNDFLKQCCKCKTFKSLAEYNKHCKGPNGIRNECKECQSVYNRRIYAKRKRKAQEEEEDDEDEDQNEEDYEDLMGRHLYGEWDGRGAPPKLAESHGDLYVMQNSRTPGELKIGRSQDVEARRCALQRSQNFRMLVLAVFPQAGHIEGRVH
jgi:hypothetical protein